MLGSVEDFNGVGQRHSSKIGEIDWLGNDMCSVQLDQKRMESFTKGNTYEMHILLACITLL